MQVVNRRATHFSLFTCRCVNVRRRSIVNTRGFASSKKVPTGQRNTQASSLLSQALDQRQSAAQDAQSDSAGPFMLGSIKRSGPAPKKWNELSTKGKGMRTFLHCCFVARSNTPEMAVVRSTARTSNLIVIITGAGLTALLAYTLLSDLFSPNSPTVKYGEACKMISQSIEVQENLPGSLVFHNNPTSSERPRHRNRHVSSQLFIDRSGREHLILHFYARVSPESPSWYSKEGYIGRTLESMYGLVEGHWSWDDIGNWTTEAAQNTKRKARDLFHYLIGNSESSSKPSFPYPHMDTPGHRQTHIGGSGSTGGIWSGITGIFSGVGKSLGGGGRSRGYEKDEQAIHFEEAEIHCDLFKVLFSS